MCCQRDRAHRDQLLRRREHFDQEARRGQAASWREGPIACDLCSVQHNTSADCSGPTVRSSQVASVGEHRTELVVPEVLEVPDRTAEEGSPGVDRSLAVGRNLEERHTAVVAGHTVAEEAGRIAGAEVADRTVAAGEDHLGYCCSNRRRDCDHQEQHRQALRENHCGRAASLRSLFRNQKRFKMY